jgi:starvation-inducible DNA-binding protein
MNSNSSKNPVAENLQVALASTYGLYLMTHNYHWNVEGKRFYPLHKMFQDQYNELFEAVDVIAERIRALDYYALPFMGENILEDTKMISNALNKETDAEARADRMVLNLVDENETVVKNFQSAKKSTRESHDDETENLMVERITAHQKAIWMLRSSLK